MVRVRVKKNHQNLYMLSNNLYRIYDFRQMLSEKYLVEEADIRKIANKEFDDVDPRHVEIILELAQECEVDEEKDSANFIVYRDGTIKIGKYMKTIKENLEEIREKFKEYLDNFEYTIEVIE